MIIWMSCSKHLCRFRDHGATDKKHPYVQFPLVRSLPQLLFRFQHHLNGWVLAATVRREVVSVQLGAVQ